MANDRACRDCDYWERREDIGAGSHGLCRREPPWRLLIIGEDVKAGGSGWPTTVDTDWCGDFEMKVDEDRE
jgi:hypothetical protein